MTKKCTTPTSRGAQVRAPASIRLVTIGKPVAALALGAVIDAVSRSMRDNPGVRT